MDEILLLAMAGLMCMVTIMIPIAAIGVAFFYFCEWTERKFYGHDKR